MRGPARRVAGLAHADLGAPAADRTLLADGDDDAAVVEGQELGFGAADVRHGMVGIERLPRAAVVAGPELDRERLGMRGVEQAGVAVHAHHQTVAERTDAPDDGVGFRDGDGFGPLAGGVADGELHAVGFEAVPLDAGGEAVEQEFGRAIRRSAARGRRARTRVWSRGARCRRGRR